MNDFVDLTDEFNDLLEAYSIGEEPAAVVDLDAWSSADLNRICELSEQVLTLRGEQRSTPSEFPFDAAGEYDGSGLPLE